LPDDLRETNPPDLEDRDLRDGERARRAWNVMDGRRVLLRSRRTRRAGGGGGVIAYAHAG
jgi:hypothetical protein